MPASPFADSRAYHELSLPNGVRVLLARDSRVVRAEAALSIGGAGQFSDPPELPGLAHLSEHMAFTANAKYPDGELERYLAEREGASNAFTALDYVCFHLTCETQDLEGALDRLAAGFVRPAFTAEALEREVGRVDAELEGASELTRELYVLKTLGNPAHPFSRPGAGSARTLSGQLADGRRLDMLRALAAFRARHYRSEAMVLCVVAPLSFAAMRRLVSPFSAIPATGPAEPARWLDVPPYLSAQLGREVLLPQGAGQQARRPRLSLAWPLGLPSGPEAQASPSAVAFVLASILGARSAGSLQAALAARGWVPPPSAGRALRLSMPASARDSFQLLTLDIEPTELGLRQRSALLAAIFAYLSMLARPGGLPREKLLEASTVARLHSWEWAPRAPDSIELAVDAHDFGTVGACHTSSAGPIVPPGATVRPAEVERARAAVAAALRTMARPSAALALVTAPPGSEVAAAASSGPETLAGVEPLCGTPFLARPMSARTVRGADARGAAAALGLRPPARNALVPLRVRPARMFTVRNAPPRADDGAPGPRLFYADTSRDAAWREVRPAFEAAALSGAALRAQQPPVPLGAAAVPLRADERWRIWLSPPALPVPSSLPMRAAPPRRAPLAALTLQLLTDRPARASAKVAALEALWLAALDHAVAGLAEAGAPAGLAYDVSLNRDGVRVSFRGLSQSLPSYARRFMRVFARHTRTLAPAMDGASTLDGAPASAASDAQAFATWVRDVRYKLDTAPPPQWTSGWHARRENVRRELDAAAPSLVLAEGASLAASVRGVLALAQGDLLPDEVLGLAHELERLSGLELPSRAAAAAAADVPWPSPGSVLQYKPIWKPRTASDPCLLPGMSLQADTCGRVAR